MAGSLKTAFFNLVKYAANDITSWLTDFNGNMDKIDTALNKNKTAVQTAQDEVDNLESEYRSLLGIVNGHTTSIDIVEKAVQGNTAAIYKIERDVDNISVGGLKAFSLADGTKIENSLTTLALFGRNLGNYFSGHVSFQIQGGNLHRYDRQGTGLLENKYITDLIRINGNPFNLGDNIWTSGTGLALSLNASNVDTYTLGIAFLADSNFTVLGIVSDTAGEIDIANNMTADIVF